MRFAESGLQRVEVGRVFGGETLDGEEVVSVGLYCKEQTGTHGHAFEQDSAGSTDAVFASDVRARQSQMMAQEVAQQQAGLYSALIDLAVDGYLDRKALTHRGRRWCKSKENTHPSE